MVHVQDDIYMLTCETLVNGQSAGSQMILHGTEEKIKRHCYMWNIPLPKSNDKPDA